MSEDPENYAYNRLKRLNDELTKRVKDADERKDAAIRGMQAEATLHRQAMNERDRWMRKALTMKEVLTAAKVVRDGLMREGREYAGQLVNERLVPAVDRFEAIEEGR